MKSTLAALCFLDLPENEFGASFLSYVYTCRAEKMKALGIISEHRMNLFSLGPQNHAGRGRPVSLAGAGWASCMVRSPICYRIDYVLGKKMKAMF